MSIRSFERLEYLLKQDRNSEIQELPTRNTFQNKI